MWGLGVTDGLGDAFLDDSVPIGVMFSRAFLCCWKESKKREFGGGRGGVGRWLVEKYLSKGNGQE